MINSLKKITIHVAIKTVSLRMQSGLLEAGEPKLFLETSTGNPFPALSPDGRWLAYASAVRVCK
jgi:hypothetical protein